jgi:hypothetical protein
MAQLPNSIDRLHGLCFGGSSRPWWNTTAPRQGRISDGRLH